VDRCRLGGWDGGVSPPCSRPRIIAAKAPRAVGLVRLPVPEILAAERKS